MYFIEVRYLTMEFFMSIFLPLSNIKKSSRTCREVSSCLCYCMFSQTYLLQLTSQDFHAIFINDVTFDYFSLCLKNRNIIYSLNGSWIKAIIMLKVGIERFWILDFLLEETGHSNLLPWKESKFFFLKAPTIQSTAVCLHPCTHACFNISIIHAK